MAKKQQEKDIKKSSTEEEVKKGTAYYQAIGRRKEATSRVRLYVVSDSEITISGITLKKGDMYVNGKAIEKYFPGEISKHMYLEPFRTTNTIGRYAVTAHVEGSGPQGQLGAFILGVSRAFEKIDKEKFRPILKKKGFLTRDPRQKERRKAGNAQKARAKKQSPKR